MFWFWNSYHLLSTNFELKASLLQFNLLMSSSSRIWKNQQIATRCQPAPKKVLNQDNQAAQEMLRGLKSTLPSWHAIQWLQSLQQSSGCNCCRQSVEEGKRGDAHLGKQGQWVDLSWQLLRSCANFCECKLLRITHFVESPIHLMEGESRAAMTSSRVKCAACTFCFSKPRLDTGVCCTALQSNQECSVVLLTGLERRTSLPWLGPPPYVKDPAAPWSSLPLATIRCHATVCCP